MWQRISAHNYVRRSTTGISPGPINIYIDDLVQLTLLDSGQFVLYADDLVTALPNSEPGITCRVTS